MPETPHDDVIEAATMGAAWAFEQIYRTMASDVLGYLRIQGCDDPEGATNEVFFRAFTRMAGFDGTQSGFRSWLFAIAHNLLIDERRKAGRRCATEPMRERFDGTSGDVEADVMARLASERVHEVLAVLAPDQRDVLLLRFLVDLSLDEVAAATGRTVGAVKALQHRGLAGLRRRIDALALEPTR